MPSSRKTQHYSLSQYADTDRPSYTEDYNRDMAAIDAAIYEASQTGGESGDATVYHDGSLAGTGAADTPLRVNTAIEEPEEQRFVPLASKSAGDDVDKPGISLANQPDNISVQQHDQLYTYIATEKPLAGSGTDASPLRVKTDDATMGVDASGNVYVKVDTSGGMELNQNGIAVRAGDGLAIDTDGSLIATGATAGALTAVAHDNTMTGTGSSTSPLTSKTSNPATDAPIGSANMPLQKLASNFQIGDYTIVKGTLVTRYAMGSGFTIKALGPTDGLAVFLNGTDGVECLNGSIHAKVGNGLAIVDRKIVVDGVLMTGGSGLTAKQLDELTIA